VAGDDARVREDNQDRVDDPEVHGGAPDIIFVSDALQARLDTFCAQGPKRTVTSVTFDAIEHFGRRLPELIDNALARPVSPRSEHTELRYLGAGPVQVRLRPGAAGARMLRRLSAELGRSWRTWVPPVLNAYLPGRREPENMPWLIQDDRRLAVAATRHRGGNHVLVIRADLVDEIVAHARREHPREACGQLFGAEDGGRAERYVPMTNADEAHEQHDNFRFDPDEQLRVHRDAQACGEGVVAVVHSHTGVPRRLPEGRRQSEAYPSAKDVLYMGLQPDVHFVIVALDGPDAEPELRSFLLGGRGEVVEDEVTIGLGGTHGR
jgi:proteasome lid subunit RPN8/RPN11